MITCLPSRRGEAQIVEEAQHGLDFFDNLKWLHPKRVDNSGENLAVIRHISNQMQDLDATFKKSLKRSFQNISAEAICWNTQTNQQILHVVVGAAI